MSKKQIHLNGFAQNSVSPHAIGLWKHPEHRGDEHGDIDYWVELAEILERGKFDALFLADVIGIYDVYQNSYQTAIEDDVQVPAHDPTLIISAMAKATKHLGFAVTASATYIEPYQLARMFSTLDHLTKGRIGWNIVTSYLKSEAINLGLKKQITHDERYDRADEYMDVVYKLWEKSWEEDAIVQDYTNGRYIDSKKVHPIKHIGKYFNVPGIHLVEPSIQRTPLLFQAGASTKGKDFAAKHAEAIFTNTQNTKDAIPALQSFIQDLEKRLKRNGRRREDVKVIPAIVPIIGSTEEEARAKFQELKSHVSYEGAAALLSGHSGVDFSKLNPDDYVENLKTDAMQSRLENYTSTDPKHKWTVRDAILYHGFSLGSAVLVGTPEQIADRFIQLSTEGGVDGFNIRQTISPATLRDFVEYVVPELQKRGVYRTAYEGETLREHYFGRGQKQLASHHYGKQVEIKRNLNHV